MLRNLLPAFALLGRATACGEWWQKEDCLADTDPRYDQDASNDLEAQHDIWSKMDGLWIGELSFFDGDGNVHPSSFYDTAAGFGWPYSYGQYQGFINITVSGSRFYQHNIFVYPPADAAFCDETANPVPAGKVNAYGSGVCGVTGGAKSFEAFGTSSYEKDGSMHGLPDLGTYGGFVNIARPIDDKTLLYTSTDETSQFHSQTNVFYPDDDRRTRTAYGFMLEPFPGAPVPTNPLYYSSLYRERKVSEAEWLAGLEAAYTLYNVPAADRVGGVPMAAAGCLTGSHAGATSVEACPDEEEWCSQDPKCSETPYVQPKATPNAGAIAGIVIGCVVVVAFVVASIAFVAHRRKLQKTKATFLGAVRTAAGRCNLGNIAELHTQIDTDGDGGVSRDELWAFVKKRQAAEPGDAAISQREFNMLFAAIDTNKSGNVNLVEFAAFLVGNEKQGFNVSGRFVPATTTTSSAEASQV